MHYLGYSTDRSHMYAQTEVFMLWFKVQLEKIINL